MSGHAYNASLPETRRLTSKQQRAFQAASLREDFVGRAAVSSLKMVLRDGEIALDRLGQVR
jgi:hypothetical protein